MARYEEEYEQPMWGKNGDVFTGTYDGDETGTYEEQEELAAKQRKGQPIYGIDPTTGKQVPVSQIPQASPNAKKTQQTNTTVVGTPTETNENPVGNPTGTVATTGTGEPKKTTHQTSTATKDETEKSDEELEREYTQGASDAYTRGYDSQLDAYKKAHQEEQDLINSLGVSQERMDAYNARRVDNEKARRNDALWRGLSTIVDMGIAAGHGNVYARKPRDVDYDKTRQLIDAEENSEYMQMMKQRQQAQNQFDQRADQAARAGGDAALKGYLKEVDAAEKERLSEINNAFKAEYQEKQMQLKRELETKRASRSGGIRSSGGSTNKDLVTINGTSGAIKVSHAMLNDYYNSLIDVINGTETLNDRGKKTHALKSACIRAGLLDENGNLTYGASQKIQAMMVNGGRPYPSFFDDYVSAAVRQELINQWNDVLASGGETTTTTTTSGRTSQSGSRTFSSSQGTQGGSQGGGGVVI